MYVDRRRVGGQLEVAPDARVEVGGAGRGRLGFGPDRQHRHAMAHRLEARRRARRPRAASASRACTAVGNCASSVLQLAEQRVVLRRRRSSARQFVVGVVVCGDCATQLRAPAPRLPPAPASARRPEVRRAIRRRTAPPRAGSPARCRSRRSAPPPASTCLRIAASAASSSAAPVVVDELAAQRLREALGGQLHLVEHARRIAYARHVEYEHDAVGGRQPRACRP